MDLTAVALALHGWVPDVQSGFLPQQAEQAQECHGAFAVAGGGSMSNTVPAGAAGPGR